MNNKKVYPDLNKVRLQKNLVRDAIFELAELGIEVLTVKFRKTNPKIEVADCPGIKKIKSALSGQGIDSNGFKYVKRSTVFCGCQVEWRQVTNG